jgi:hypothetical protein
LPSCSCPPAAPRPRPCPQPLLLPTQVSIPLHPPSPYVRQCDAPPADESGSRPWSTPRAECARQTVRTERPDRRARCAWSESDGPRRMRKHAAGRAAPTNGACEAATQVGAKCELRGTMPMSRRAQEVRCSGPELRRRCAGQKEIAKSTCRKEATDMP